MSKSKSLSNLSSISVAEKQEGSEENDWDQEENEVHAALNVSFLEGLEDVTKFSYAGVCASTLHLLYNQEREYCHEFVSSFVAHLCLPSNVITTMHAVADGEAQQSSDIFLETLQGDENAKENPQLFLNDMVMWALTATNGCYDARTRYTIRHITWKMQIKYEEMEKVEEVFIQMLRESSDKEKEEQEATRLKKARSRKWKRFALIGLATAGGGALVGLTGGLAAPLVAAGAGAILGGASAAALGSVAGIAVITSLFGAAGAGLTGYKMKRRVGGIDEFLFKPLSISAQPQIAIAISGWLSNDDSSGFVYPWRSLRQSKEQYSLVWESKHLMRLGSAFEYILNSLVSVAATEALKYTVLAGLITAVAWPATLISAAGVIDNPWSVCLQRAAQVGRQLAEVLLAREHGHRPVTLIGFSLGGRVIFHCLTELSKRKKHKGIIEDVYLLGTPVSGDPDDWKSFRTVVSGHITNGYCKTDWLLRFLYRTSSRQVKVAGLQPVEWEDRRMINIDLSSVIDGHLDYAKNMETVLSAVGVRTRDSEPSPAEAENVKPESSAVDETIKPESSAVDETIKPESSVVDETIKPESSVVDETIKPESSAVDETIKPESSVVDETIKPESSVVDETIKPESSVVDETIKPESSAVDETIKPESSAAAAVDDGKSSTPKSSKLSLLCDETKRSDAGDSAEQSSIALSSADCDDFEVIDKVT